ncbi:MAG TPA: hypothetical protein VH414_20645 [Lichenihabitans sp.]|jgi:hypothetical protein|nr:hypothetical protein [Lichenihabitans sp.]
MIRSTLRVRLGAATLAIASLLPVARLAAVPAAVAPAAPATSPDDALKTAFDALPEADRRAVQNALIWVGDYTAAVSGAFGPRTRDALMAYGKEAKQPPLAVLEPAGRERLVAAARAASGAVGFATVRDKRAGLALGLPQKILTKVTTTDTGTRSASGDGSLVVDTLSRPAGDGGLAALFDRMSAATATRAIAYKFSKPGFFVIAGETGERKFYSRFAIEPEGGERAAADRLIRGFTLTYPKADAKRMDRITIAMAATFDPFPPVAAGMAPTAKPTPPGVAAAAPGLDAQAVIVAPGLALTSLVPQRCPAPQVGGTAVSFKASDAASGLALLAVPTSATASPPIAAATDPQGTYFALFKQSDGLDVAPAILREAPAGPVVSGPLQQAVAGSPVISRAGQLVGTVRTGPASPKTIGGTVLATDYVLTGSAAIQAFLGRAGVTIAEKRTPGPTTLGDAVAPWVPLLIEVTCGTAPAAPAPPPSGG